MAAKATRILVLLLVLAMGVTTVTAVVDVTSAVAAGGTSKSGGSTNGDPDTPKDSAPKPTVQQTGTASPTGFMTRSGDVTAMNHGEMVRTWARQFVVSLLGRPGLVR